MQERLPLTEKEINQDLLRPVLTTPMWWWVAVGVCATVVAAAAGAAGFMFVTGVGVLGVNRPVMWGFLIVNFVFWVGISHAGIMLSAILRLTQAEWRRLLRRALWGRPSRSKSGAWSLTSASSPLGSRPCIW